MKNKKFKFNNDEILLATIIGAIDKINIDVALTGKDYSFACKVFAILDDFAYKVGEACEDLYPDVWLEEARQACVPSYSSQINSDLEPDSDDFYSDLGF